jgi:protein-tyrosine kinase
MSLIEKAAKRLEELRRAGAEEPVVSATSHADPKDRLPARQEQLPTPEAIVREISVREAQALPITAAPAVVGVEPPAHRNDSAGTDTIAPARVEIDLARLRTQGFVTPDEPQSLIADEFRVVKRTILRNTQGLGDKRIRNSNLVLVTSSLQGEGKTFTAANLAISIAMEFDNTVLLVDGDVAHPALPELLGTPKAPGLLDLLTRDDLDIGDAIRQTNIEGLSILPAGTRNRRATELLASEKMALLLGELASRVPDRIIIFDSPPLLATTEARVLSTHMGQIIMVVAADATSQHAVRQALATIENCEVVLMLLNKSAKTDVGTYYGY